jgi:hypothetical protein
MNFLTLTVCFFCFYCASAFAQEPDSTSYYSSVHYKGLAVLGNDEELQGCQYHVVSVIDSFLYIQLTFVGIEAGKIMATPNNILFINKLHKNFFEGDYSVFERILNMEIDFYTLQDFFNGFLIYPPEGIGLYYQRDFISYPFPFFSMLMCEYDTLSLRLDVKKVTFNNVPEVSAVIPKNYTMIEI